MAIMDDYNGPTPAPTVQPNDHGTERAERLATQELWEESVRAGARAEATRRLARYDEAIRLLREVWLEFKSCDLVDEIATFIDAEPAGDRKLP